MLKLYVLLPHILIFLFLLFQNVIVQSVRSRQSSIRLSKRNLLISTEGSNEEDDEDLIPKKVVIRKNVRDNRPLVDQVLSRPPRVERDFTKNNPRMLMHKYDPLKYTFPFSAVDILVEFDPELQRTWEDDVFALKYKDKKINSNDKRFQGGDWGGWRKPSGISPRAKVYYAKIAEFYLSGKDDECVEAFERMRYDFMLPRNEIPVGAYRTMLKLLVDKGYYKLAKEECYEPIRQKYKLTLGDLNNLMKIYLGLGEYEKIDDVFESLKIIGYYPDAESYAIKLRKIAELGSVEEAEEYLEFIKGLEFTSSDLALLELLKIYQNKGLVEKRDALEAKYFEDPNLLTSEFYDYYFDRLDAEKLYEKVIETFNTIIQTSILTLNKNMFYKTIIAHCNLDNPEGLAKNVFLMMEIRNLINDVDLWVPILRKRFDWSENIDIMRWVAKALTFKTISPTKENYVKVMYTLMEDANYDQLQSNLAMFRKNKIEMTPRAVHLAIESLLKLDNFEGAKQIYIQEIYAGDKIKPYQETVDMLKEYAEKNGQDATFISECPDLAKLEYIPPPVNYSDRPWRT